jgi:hypothetical protein
MPPLLYQQPPGSAALRPDQLLVRNGPTSLSNPFALEFGARLRETTSGGERDPVSKTNYATICMAVKYLAHRNACTKWVAYGQCRDPNCTKLHDNWPANINGEVLNSKYRAFAQMAGVSQNWQPVRRGRQ